MVDHCLFGFVTVRLSQASVFQKMSLDRRPSPGPCLPRGLCQACTRGGLTSVCDTHRCALECSQLFALPLQHHQHQAAQALHLASPQQQSAIYHAGLAPTPPAITPASNTQSPQSSFPAAQQTVFTIHPSHVQPAYTNPPHMAHVPQVNQL